MLSRSMLDIGYWILDIGYWILDIGYWMLDVGCSGPAHEVAEGDESTEVRSVIDVDILGHIFEQSITDLERLRHRLATGEGAPTFLSASGAPPRSASPQKPELK